MEVFIACLYIISCYEPKFWGGIGIDIHSLWLKNDLQCYTSLCFDECALHTKMSASFMLCGGVASCSVSVPRRNLFSPKLPLIIYVPDLKTTDMFSFHGGLQVFSELHLLQVYFHDVEKYQSCVNIHSKKASNLVPPVGKLHEMLHIRSGRDALAQTPSIIITKMITRCSILLKGSINAFCASSYRE